jgi:hypothetical protein
LLEGEEIEVIGPYCEDGLFRATKVYVDMELEEEYETKDEENDEAELEEQKDEQEDD